MLIAAPMAVQAQALWSDALRIPTDPTFLTLRGQLSLDTEYTYARVGGTHTGDGPPTTSKASSNLLSETAAYGVTNDVQIDLAWAYDFGGDESFEGSGGPPVSHDDRGVTDPRFGLTWRAVDQRGHPVSVDLAAEYAPDVFAATTSTATTAGSEALGAQEAILRVAVGHQTRAFTIQGAVLATWEGDSRIRDPANGGVSTATSSWTPTAQLNSQLRFSRRFSLNLTAGYDFGSRRTVTEDDGVSYVDRPSGDERLVAALNYHFIPSVLVGGVDYSHTFFDHEQIDFPLAPASNGAFARSGDTVGVRLTYVSR